MIHALHLLWIIPLATMFGYMIAALMVASKEDKQYNSREK